MKVLQVISGVKSHQFAEIYIKGHQQKLGSLSQQASLPAKHRFDIIIWWKKNGKNLTLLLEIMTAVKEPLCPEACYKRCASLSL